MPFGFGFVSSFFGATFLIILVVIVSKVKTDFARDGALPQSRTTKWRCSFDALLWCVRRPHSAASLKTAQL